MIKNGIYAASVSVLNNDKSLDVKSTINHAESAIKTGLHGVFFFGKLRILKSGKKYLITFWSQFLDS